MAVITQDDINLLKQSSRTVYARIDVLNKNFKTIGTLDGTLVSDSYSFDATSDVRKTANITLCVKDSDFELRNDGRIWFDKYIRLKTGIFNIRKRETVWYDIGLFVYMDAGYNYNASTRQLTISLSDLMVLLNGERGGTLSGKATKIVAGSSIRNAMVQNVTQLGRIQKYRIDDVGKDVPYDLEFSTGSNVQAINVELRDLYSGWETFFDDDTFVCQQYPTAVSDPIILDDSVMRDLVIDESLNTSFAGVYNVVEVWGKCNDTDTYSTEVTYSQNVYNITNSAIAELSSNEEYGFKAPAENTGGFSVKINSFTAYPVYGENNEEIAAGRIKKDKSYVVKFKKNGSQSYFYFEGEYQICGIAKLMSREPTAEEKAADAADSPTTNISYVVEPDTPYGVDQIGVIRKVCSGGEYSDIYSEDLALQRAEYELWLASDMKNEISLEMIEIPWLGVNQKIEYTPGITGEKTVYMVKSKSGSTTGGTMTINAVRFQPLYPWLEA